MSGGKFKRVLNAREVLALAFGAMIGWGRVVLIWTLLGLGFYLWARAAHAEEASRIVNQELRTGHSDN